MRRLGVDGLGARGARGGGEMADRPWRWCVAFGPRMGSCSVSVSNGALYVLNNIMPLAVMSLARRRKLISERFP